MIQYQWIFERDNEVYTIEVIQTPFFGKRTLTVNGETCFEMEGFKNVFNPQKTYLYFSVNESDCYILTYLQGMRVHFELFVDGGRIDPTFSKSLPISTVLSTLFLLFGFFLISTSTIILALNVMPPPGVPDFIFEEPLKIILWFTFFMSGGAFIILVLGSTYSKSRGNKIINGLILILSAWIFITSMVFWAETTQGNLGVIAAVKEGLAAWVLFIPILSAICMIVVAFQPIGIQLILIPLSLLLAIVSVAAMDWSLNQSVPGLSKGVGWISPFFVAPSLLVLSFFSGSELPPLGSLLSRIQYFGAYKHYIDMYTLAFKYRFQVAGPSKVTDGAMYTRGSRKRRFVSTATAKDGFTVSIETRELVWPFNLFVGFNEAEFDEEDKPVVVELKDREGKSAILYIWPPRDYVQDDERIKRLSDEIQRAKFALNGTVRIWSEYDSINYHHSRKILLPVHYQEIDRLFDFLISLANFMEIEGYTIEEDELLEGDAPTTEI
jgi:hypothetical protein